MPPKITRNHEYAKILARTVKTNRGFTSLANKVDTIDSADVTEILSTVSASSLEVYNTLDSLPTNSLTKGGQGYVKATQRLYVSDSFGWYSMALVNLTPTQTLDPSGNITLSTDGTSTIVTITATDSDQPESQLSYSIESDGNMLATGTTVTQDSSVFTITPLSEDNGGVAGNFTLTFKTTDSVNIATTTKDFSLAFTAPSVSGSASTIALMKADGSSKTNSDITYTNSSNNTTNFTETGDPTASTFSPYRSGGYSTFMVQADQFEYASHADFAFGTGNFTIEYWIYPNGNATASVGMPDMRPANTNGNYVSVYINTSNQVTFYVNASYFINYSANTALTSYQWNHLAIVRNGSTTTMYINGVSVGTASDSTNYLQTKCLINGGSYLGSNIGWANGCYIKDFRIVKGTAVYTSNFTPPTEALTAISGTSLFTCHAPYIADGSSSRHTPSITGSPETLPFGPYDYSPWTADDVGGSVYFDGTSDYMQVSNSSDFAFGTGDFTVEAWVNYTTFSGSGGQAIISNGTSISSGTSGHWYLTAYGATDLRFGRHGVAQYTSVTSNLVVDAWNHIAVTRSGTTVRIFVNGVSLTTSDTGGGVGSYDFNNTSGILMIGEGASFSKASGHIADVRIIKGTAQYTSNFTPPTAPLSHTGSGTSMLMNNKSDANVYDAAAAGRISLMGNANTNTSVRKFTTSSSVVHGSNAGVRFDDLTPEYLGGDFTIQFWLYPTAWYNNGHIFGHWVGGQYHPWLLYTSTTTYWKFYASSNNSSWNLASAGNTSIDRWTNSWKHVAMTYDQSAGTVKFWLDGTLESTFTGITGLTSNGYTSSVLSFGEDQNSGYPGYAGYLQDIKVSRSVEYTANFTPPTTEFEL